MTFSPGEEVEEEEVDNTTTRPHMGRVVNPRPTIPTPTTTTTHPKCHTWIPEVSLHQTLQLGHQCLHIRWAPLLPSWAPQLLKCTPLYISRYHLTWHMAGGYPLISPISNTQVWEEAMAASSFR